MISKTLITLATLGYGIAPMIADLNATHVLNPDWPAHARIHMVWLLGFGFFIAMLALWLLWGEGKAVLSAMLGLCVMAGFWVAAATSPLYGGALSAAGNADTKLAGIEVNVLFFAMVSLMLVAGILLQRSATRA